MGRWRPQEVSSTWSETSSSVKTTREHENTTFEGRVYEGKGNRKLLAAVIERSSTIFRETTITHEQHLPAPPNPTELARTFLPFPVYLVHTFSDVRKCFCFMIFMIA